MAAIAVEAGFDWLEIGTPLVTCQGLAPVRAVVEVAGVRDVLTKTLGTNNPHNVVRATLQGLLSLRDPDERLAELGRARS